jgi:hypothetical protein
LIPDEKNSKIIFQGVRNAEVEKYFSFCQLSIMRQKVSAKRRGFQQNLKDMDLFEEKTTSYFGS